MASQIEIAVYLVIAEWQRGRLASGEVTSRLIDLITADNVAEVVAVTPEEWRGQLIEDFRYISATEGPLCRIFGGIYRYEMEGDPERRAAMKAEVEAENATQETHFEMVIRPAIRVWVRQHDEKVEK